jgi:hypothetical protein
MYVLIPYVELFLQKTLLATRAKSKAGLVALIYVVYYFKRVMQTFMTVLAGNACQFFVDRDN